MMNSMQFGVHELCCVDTGSSATNNVVQLNRYQYLVTAKSGIFKCEDNNVIRGCPIRLRASAYIEEYGLLAGITEVGGELIITNAETPDRPIISGFKTDQVAVFHLMYSPASHSLITVGSGISVWYVKVKMQNHTTEIDASMIRIVHRSVFCLGYETSIINPPVFDYAEELIYIPSKYGFMSYDLDGNEYKLMSKQEATAQTAAAVTPDARKLLTAHLTEGFCLWKRGPILEKRLSSIVSPVLSIRFIDRNFAIFMDTNLLVYILDVRTSKFWHVLSLNKKPNSFIVQNHELCLCQGSKATRYKIVIPWNLWQNQTSKVQSIRRYSRINEAARIVFHAYNKVVTMCSPKTGNIVTTASSIQTSTPCDFLYDRGTWIKDGYYCRVDKSVDHDILMLLMGNAKTVVFTTSDNPCNEVMYIDMHATSAVMCTLKDQVVYCLSNRFGELHFYDYLHMKLLRRFLIMKEPIYKIYFHERSNTIVCILENSIARFSLTQMKVVGKIMPWEKSCISAMRDDLLLFGFADGSVEALRVGEEDIMRIGDGMRPHFKEVTGFAFAQTFFVSVSKDQTVKVWTYDMSVIADIGLPFPLYSVEVLNGKRDILVGTDNEIMIIRGRRIFGKEVDPEIPEIDNYDVLNDELGIQKMAFLDDKDGDEDEVGFFESRKKLEEVEVVNKPTWPSQKRLNTIRMKIAAMKAKQEAPLNVVTPMTEDDDEKRKKQKIAEMMGLTNSSDQNKDKSGRSGATGDDNSDGDKNGDPGDITLDNGDGGGSGDEYEYEDEDGSDGKKRKRVAKKGKKGKAGGKDGESGSDDEDGSGGKKKRVRKGKGSGDSNNGKSSHDASKSGKDGDGKSGRDKSGKDGDGKAGKDKSGRSGDGNSGDNKSIGSKDVDAQSAADKVKSMFSTSGGSKWSTDSKNNRGDGNAGSSDGGAGRSKAGNDSNGDGSGKDGTDGASKRKQMGTAGGNMVSHSIDTLKDAANGGSPGQSKGKGKSKKNKSKKGNKKRQLSPHLLGPSSKDNANDGEGAENSKELPVLNMKKRALTTMTVRKRSPLWQYTPRTVQRRRPRTPKPRPKPIYGFPTPEVRLDKDACLKKIMEGEDYLKPLLQRFSNEDRLYALYDSAFPRRESPRIPSPVQLPLPIQVPSNALKLPVAPQQDLRKSKEVTISIRKQDEINSYRHRWPAKDEPASVIIPLCVEEEPEPPNRETHGRYTFTIQDEPMGEFTGRVIAQGLLNRKPRVHKSEQAIHPKKVLKLSALEKPEPIPPLRIVREPNSVYRSAPNLPSAKRPRRYQTARQSAHPPKITRPGLPKLVRGYSPPVTRRELAYK